MSMRTGTRTGTRTGSKGAGWTPGLAAVVAAVALVGGVTPARAETAAAARALTVEDTVSLALQTNPRLLAARARLRAGSARATSAGRRLLPVVRVSDELQRYDSAFVINFPIPGAPPGEGFRARDATTNTFVASLSQPLVGLLRLDRERRAVEQSDEAAAADVATAEAELRQSVQTYFLTYFEARALEALADTSARELGAEAVVARARLASGVITPADLLRIEVAIANAHQQALQAHSQAEVARARLLAIIGLDARQGEGGGRDVTLVEPTALLAAAQAPEASLATLQASAHRSRPEVAARVHLTRAAEHQARARGLALLPDINLEAAYLRVDGQVFTPKNSAFVGLKADWAVWEWGATEHLRRAAEADADAARRDAEATDRQIDAEVASTLAEGESARGAVTAANQAIASAEEAFRVTEAGVKAGSATTTDLLESQSALTQARLNLIRARYELALAHVGLARASGGG